MDSYVIAGDDGVLRITQSHALSTKSVAVPPEQNLKLIACIEQQNTLCWRMHID